MTNNVSTDNLEHLLKEGIHYWRLPIYRLSINYREYRGKSFEDMNPRELQVSVQNLLKDLQGVKLPPNDIFVHDGEQVEAMWYPPFPIIPETIEDSARLIDNFIKFANSFGFTSGSFNYGDFCDDPHHLSPREDFFIRVLGITTKLHSVGNFPEVLSQLSDVRDKYATPGIYHLG